MAKFLDAIGLAHVKDWIVNNFAQSNHSHTPVSIGAAAYEHNHSANEITTGQLSPNRIPYATTETVGGIKVGTGLSISNGVLSATGGGTGTGVEIIRL